MNTVSEYNKLNYSGRAIKVIDFKVDKMQFYSPTLYLMVLSPLDEKVKIPNCRPGQFVQIQVPSGCGAFLRRPISIYNVDDNSLGLLILNVGKGTQALSKARIGDVFSIIIPLGNSFTSPVLWFPEEPKQNIKPLLIGGGVGIAPLLMLGKSLKENGIKPTFLFGAKTKTLFPDLSSFQKCGTLHISTEDESWGEKGFVTEHHIINEPNAYNCIYTCGPTPMMKAVAKIAREKNIHCEASLENHMACGVGVCLCCTEPTIDGYKSVCTDGPVFDVNKLMW
ncbi:dihydroorotate dehydrogenase electron transfer subunit [Porphyromonadaceae bacterium W3.11]|nr:dihydroorotate dehydrogenase electron transfer subunit [Porphyromonadaceae bacterium W3.11]